LKRPSTKELGKKIASAKEAIKGGKCYFAHRGKALGELTDMDIHTEEVWELLHDCLDEIKPADYVGSKPPQKSYEKSIEGKELFAFAWDSENLGKRMYLKFVVSDNRLYYVSFHEDKKTSKG
jgi:hypothetical protein